ncbi:hypothetical protein NECAME_05742 [Necator americanus]|uniref:Uncharacterized protein n=1 Tax=Necator americanus TaxID=51031 RepID=W2U0Y4_NECAM|nr:hypothetical protein NECAME_05742 [Necator americanus]ETN87021.1 hypothetical protein NECAME_05742 [Necator americanus]
MVLLESVLFLVAICHGLNENDIPENLRRNFDRNKVILPASHQIGESLYANVTIRAFTTVLKSLVAERWKSLAKELASYDHKKRIRERLASMLTRGNAMSFGSHSVNETGPNEAMDTGDKSTLHHFNSLIRRVSSFFLFLPLFSTAMADNIISGVILAAKASGHDIEDNKSLRVLSPRIGNQEEDQREVSVLSPDITFLGHRDDVDVNGKSQLLELIMEISGAASGMRKALENVKKADQMLANADVQMTKTDVEDILGKKERQKIEVIQSMEKKYTSEQMNSFEKRGFAFMTSTQRRLVYGPSSPFYDKYGDRRARGLNAVDLEKKLINLIRLQALGMSDYNRRMRIDLIRSPTVLANFKGFATHRKCVVVSYLIEGLRYVHLFLNDNTF